VGSIRALLPQSKNEEWKMLYLEWNAVGQNQPGERDKMPAFYDSP
jgi:hypothetical protein